MSDFEELFGFNLKPAERMGAEEEFFMVDPSTGELIPASIKLFQQIGEEGNIKPELSAHMGEVVTGERISVQALFENIVRNRMEVHALGRAFGFKPVYQSMPPGDFELEVYPKQRYIDIQARMSEAKLRNAWIAGLHIHIGCATKEDLIFYINCFRNDLPYLLAFSAGEGSERLSRYKEMSPDLVPPHLESFEHYEEIAKQKGFHQDPRRCWWLIRPNPHGTFEIRVFDAQPDPKDVGRIASLLMKRYLLYREGVVKPDQKSVKEIVTGLEFAAGQGRQYEPSLRWRGETLRLANEHLRAYRSLYELDY